MARGTLSLHFILILVLVQHSYLVTIASTTEAAGVTEKVEAGTPALSDFAPPEGNTSFNGGTTWCVAIAGASQVDLQNALDWACGEGKADCKPIQPGGPCFAPDTLLSHASYAFNSYYQQSGNSDISCNFGGTAAVTRTSPSYKKCVYPASGSGSVRSSAAILHQGNASLAWWKLTTAMLLLLYMRS